VTNKITEVFLRKAKKPVQKHWFFCGLHYPIFEPLFGGFGELAGVKETAELRRGSGGS
jgi:hypothetical protein